MLNRKGPKDKFSEYFSLNYVYFLTTTIVHLFTITVTVPITDKIMIFFWLAWAESFRTFDWHATLGDLETTKKEIAHLLSLV